MKSGFKIALATIGVSLLVGCGQQSVASGTVAGVVEESNSKLVIEVGAKAVEEEPEIYDMAIESAIAEIDVWTYYIDNQALYRKNASGERIEKIADDKLFIEVLKDKQTMMEYITYKEGDKNYLVALKEKGNVVELPKDGLYGVVFGGKYYYEMYLTDER